MKKIPIDILEVGQKIGDFSLIFKRPEEKAWIVDAILNQITLGHSEISELLGALIKKFGTEKGITVWLRGAVNSGINIPSFVLPTLIHCFNGLVGSKGGDASEDIYID